MAVRGLGGSHPRVGTPTCGPLEAHVSESLPGGTMAPPVPGSDPEEEEDNFEDTKKLQKEEEDDFKDTEEEDANKLWTPLPRSQTLQTGNLRPSLLEDAEDRTGIFSADHGDFSSKNADHGDFSEEGDDRGNSGEVADTRTRAASDSKAFSETLSDPNAEQPLVDTFGFTRLFRGTQDTRSRFKSVLSFSGLGFSASSDAAPLPSPQLASPPGSPGLGDPAVVKTPLGEGREPGEISGGVGDNSGANNLINIIVGPET